MYQNMTAKDRKSDVSYLNKLVDQYNNTYHHSINKNPINDAYFPSNKKKLRQILKLLNLKWWRVIITKSKNIFSKVGQKKYLL